MNHPYSRKDLAALRVRLEEDLADYEREYPEAQPLPPMDEEEARALLFDFSEVATIRLLTRSETFLIGQLMSAYRMAVEARMLGKRGRYYVIGEEDLAKLPR